jgi:broad specificity phosphatase PhoE
MLTIYFARHGQTEHSRENSFCGTLHAPLTPDGHRMAEALAEHWSHLPIQAVYASDRSRAIDTARPIAKRLNLTVQVEPGLGEIAYGEWEGRSEDEVEREQPEAFRAWHAHPDLVAPPGGETALQIEKRALAAIERIRGKAPDGAVLVVSHKATLRILICAFLGIPVGEFRRKIGMPVAAVSAVEFKSSGPLLKFLGDTQYLPEDLRGARGT